MRIIHFSDIHIGRGTKYIGALFDKRLLGLINYRLNRRHHIRENLISSAITKITELKPDVVVCTGDITCIGSPEEFRAGCENLQPLAANPDFKFIYLPGNHDAYSASAVCRASLKQAFEFLNHQSYTLEDLPTVLETPAASLLLLNEALPTPIWSSAGRLDSESEQRLTDWLAETDTSRLKLLLGHYPTLRADGTPLPRRRRLKNGEVIRKALQQGELDISLCGHIHDAFVYKERNGTMEICAGSLTTTGFINVIDLKTQPEKQIRQEWVAITKPD